MQSLTNIMLSKREHVKTFYLLFVKIKYNSLYILIFKYAFLKQVPQADRKDLQTECQSIPIIWDTCLAK
jgi:hypothetical protein